MHVADVELREARVTHHGVIDRGDRHELVDAVLVPAAGAEIDVDAVLKHARQHLADFKVPQYIAVSGDPLPRNPGGKVLKAQLRDHTEWGKPLR